MIPVELQAAGEALLAQARALRSAFPDPIALAAVAITAAPLVASTSAQQPLGRALSCLRDEMVLVQGGGAATLMVLEDEMANVERHLSGQ